MLSLDANLLFYAFNSACPEHARAERYLAALGPREDVALSEFILCEFYVLLRNPAVVSRPLSAGEAATVVHGYRAHPRWKIIGFPPASRPLHDELWRQAAAKGFARRRIWLSAGRRSGRGVADRGHEGGRILRSRWAGGVRFSVFGGARPGRGCVRPAGLVHSGAAGGTSARPDGP